MNRISQLVSAAGAGVAALALCTATATAATPAHRAAPRHDSGAAGVVFVQNDALDGNAVLAYDRADDGNLALAGTYPTGGAGGQLSGSVVDHLASEGSLSYDRSAGLLYAVNAGSNTLTVFGVRGDRLVRRQSVDTGGQFPVSVATSGHFVFVLNARNGGSISGFLQLDGVLVPIPAWHRELNLNTSAPGQPNEFVSTPGQIGFTLDGRTLLVSTKNGGNSVEAFRIGLFGPAQNPVVTSLPGTVPFGFAFDRAGDLVLTEAGPSAIATFAIDRDGSLHALDSAATGQAATCWVVTAHHTAYTSNAGSGTLSLYRTAHDGTLTSRGTAATDAGTVDAAVSSDGRYLSVQAGRAGVVDSFRIGAHGALTPVGSVTVPGGVGGEGIVAG